MDGKGDWLTTWTESADLTWQIAIAVASVAVVILPLFFLAMRRAVRKWEKRYRDPFSKGLLRPAGTGCRDRAEDKMVDLLSLFAGVMGMAFGFAIAAILSRSLPIALLLFSVITVLLLLSGWQANRLINQARTARMGYLGELAVAEALAELPFEEGWRIFHDLRLRSSKSKTFNIDHVVVGPTGVFAIETKVKSPSRERSSGDSYLTIHGDRIEFPDGKKWSDKHRRQARGNARDLREWLNESDVACRYVAAYLVLPGWDVKYARGKRNKRICATKNLVAFLRREEGSLSEKEIRAFSRRLESHCRDLSFERSDNPFSAYRHESRKPAGPIEVSKRGERKQSEET